VSTDAATRLQAALDAIKLGLPPAPSSSRFKPLRMGMLGIWQYDEQEFFFHDGRLVLLGRNGSGKTKVLEVTSPFLFDADLTARRLDPFGHASRSMRDNLLFGSRKHQVGYVWCEYGRVTETGLAEYVTIGAGLRAQAAKAGAPESWYFLTSQRVGVDLQLHDSTWTLPGRTELAKVLEDNGRVFKTAGEYRTAVGERLFGMTPARYRSLVELLLTMRRPKLSENFGVEKLAQTISDGLPPVDNGLIDELARGFDELSRDREELENLERVGREVKQFLRTYRIYAQRMVRHYGAGLRRAATRYDGVTRRKREAEQQLEHFQAGLSSLNDRMAQLNRAVVEQHVKINTLEQRPELEQQAVLLALEQQARKAEDQLGRAGARLAEARREHDLSETELQQAEEQLEWVAEQFDEAERHGADAADRCGLRGEHTVHSRRLLTDLEAAQRVLTAVVDARRAAVRNARALRQQVDLAQSEFDRAQAVKDDLMARKEELSRAIISQQAKLTAEIEATTTALLSWIEDCRELHVASETRELMLRGVEQAGQPGVIAPASLARSLASEAETALLTALAQLNADHARLRSEHRDLVDLRRRISEEQDTPPPEPLVPRRDRVNDPIPGAPLWRVIEFAPGVTEDLQANIETALLGAGLLDAWITPVGAVVHPGTLDTLLEPGPGIASDRSLSSVLSPSRQQDVQPETIQAVLNRIGYRDQSPHGDDGTSGDWISGDGGWALGPLRGRTEGRPASYIGAAARAAARLRRLRELDSQLDDLETRTAAVLQLHQSLEQRIERLRRERNTCPDNTRVLEFVMRLDALLERAGELAAESRQAGLRCDECMERVRAATVELEIYGRENYVGTTLESLDTLDESLTSYREHLSEVFSQASRYRLCRSQVEAQRSRCERDKERRELAEDEHERMTEEAIILRAEYETRHGLDGADIDQVLTELNIARERAERLRIDRAAVEADVHAATEGLGAARSTLAAVEEQRQEREGERSEAMAEFEQLRTFGLLTLAGVPGAREDTANLTTSLEEARAAERHLDRVDSDDRARNQARNNVDERFRALQFGISGPDWNPWGANEGGLFVAKVTHNGEDHSLTNVNEIIEDEIATRKTYLDEQERKLFAEVLIGRVGEHLRDCRARAMMLYSTMNDLLAKRRTASGRQMRLLWEADEEAGPKAQRALDIFDRQSMDLLTDEARAELVDFLTDRVRETREADREGDWREHLREALDYRQWSRFRIQIRDNTGDNWTTLTDAKHQQGSGGEKAVMLQLPLFVAAAAHYVGAAPTAPRPIYLDEAFAGIDAEMRGECMKLLVDLDLDFVMASHDEWGFHEEVPGLVTYSLFRDPSEPGVLATPFLWDGTASSELRDPMLDSHEDLPRDGDDLFNDGDS
jgi:uncharacterized protein (TIGR02680 family)